MAEGATDPRVERAISVLRQGLGENLYSCILYGSAVRGDARPDSDLNLLLVLQHSTPEAHAAIAEAIASEPAIEPFILDLAGLERSRRVFAVKFRSIRRNYRLLCGADVLADFHPDPQLLKFLAEQSLRNVLLRTTHAYVRMSGHRERYTRFLVRTLPAVHAAISEMLRCDGIDVPRDHVARLPVLERSLETDVSILRDLEELRRSGRVLSAGEVFDDHARLTRLLAHVAQRMEARWPSPMPS